MNERIYSSWMLERIAIGDCVRLRLGLSTIGRHSSSTIRILDSTHVSRHHAEVEVSNDDQIVTIKDLNSSNGIVINGNQYRNETITLRNADEIGIGVSLEELNPDDISAPLYQLKYAPIRRARPPQPPQPPLQHNAVLTQINNAAKKKEEIETHEKDKTPQDKTSGSNDNDKGDNESNVKDDKPSYKGSEQSNRRDTKNFNKEVSKPNADKEKPCCSKDIQREPLKTPQPPPQQISNEIFEISDDDEEEVDKSEDKENPTNEKPEQQIDILKVNNIKKEKINSGYEDDKIANLNQAENANKVTNNINGKEKDNLKVTDGKAVSLELDSQRVVDKDSNKSLEKNTIFEVSDDEELPVEKSNRKEKEMVVKVDDKLKQIEINVKNEKDKLDFTNFKIPNLRDDDNSNEDLDLINPSQNTKNLNLDEQEEEDNSNKTNDIFESNNDIPVSAEDDLDYLNPSQRVLTEEEDKEVTNKIKDCEKKATSSANIDKQIISHVPIISNLKKERIRSVSADIQNIFGDINKEDDFVQTSLKELNPLVYHEINGNKNTTKTLNNGDFITLTDDEEEVEELGTIIPQPKENNEVATRNIELTKSPSIFDTSLNDSKDEEEEKEKLEDKKPIRDNEKLREGLQENKSLVDNVDLDEYCNYEPQSDDEDIEDLMFSQVLINDMKAELQGDIDNEQDIPLPELPLPIESLLQPVIEDIIQIKQEPGLQVQSLIPKELENSCWTISDDEDDEEFQTKVNDWSNRIFSQSFSHNVSQVYDLHEPDEDDDEEENLNLLDDDIDNIADFYNNNFEKKQVENNSDDFNSIFADLDDEVKSFKQKPLETDEKNKKIVQHKTVNEKIDTNEQTLKDKVENDIQSKNKLIIKIKEKSQELTTNENSNNLTDSPVIRKRSISKNKPVIESSSSSSEDEQEKEKCHIVTTKNNEKNETDTKEAVDKFNRMGKMVMPEKKPPQVIDAPSLPKYKGKLRGVSAEQSKSSSSSSFQLPKTTGTSYTLSSIKHKFQEERLKKDLKRKWLEKPSISKRRDKEHTKFIKECRKDRLKELAEKHKSPTKENTKRKLSTEEQEHKPKKAKVKVTTHNRGAFLVEDETKLHPPPPTSSLTTANKIDFNKQNKTKLPLAATANKKDYIKQFKIPKIIDNKPESNQKEPSVFKRSLSINTDSLKNDEYSTNNPKRSNSLDSMETFSQQISKPDELLLKKQYSDPKKNPEQKSYNTNDLSHPSALAAKVRRPSITDTSRNTMQNQTTHIFKKPANPPPLNPICKDARAARAHRTTNKITFASMEKNIIESEECKRKLNLLSSNTTSSVIGNIQSILKLTPSRKVKTVRFNDTPLIHYIERVSGANKKVLTKDLMPLSTNKDRRHLVRQTYPIIDCMDRIISKILSWSNEWLIKRNAAAEAAGDVIFPMPHQFNSFEHYKSIIFPLMKLEFISLLEREFKSTYNVKNFKVSLDYVTQNKDRFMLITKLNYKSKEQQDSGQYDLVLLESDRRGPQIFAHMTNSRNGTGSCNTIVYEIIAKNFTLEYLKAIKEFNVRPVMDKVRVNFGSLDAVYQLNATPLFNKIMNPIELLKCKPPPRKKINYRGCDQLNEKQRQVLLNTYYKIIDETTPNITLLKGPPGTGKSMVITNLALQTLYGDEVRYLDKKILICAQSNAAVDVIAGKLYEISLKMRAEIRFRLIRYGVQNKIDAKVLPISLQKLVEHDQLKKRQAKNKDVHVENKENLKNQIFQLEAEISDLSSRNIQGTFEEDALIEKQRQLKSMRTILNQHMRPEDERSLYAWYLSNANIICATLSSCVNLMQYVNYFDICIIDEATQCTEPWTLLPLKFGINSLVLVGDTQQLPATVLSKKANELGLGTSLFTRIQHCLDNIPCTSLNGSASVTTPNNIICGLQTQYRMNPEICKWPNQYFYRNELINGKITLEYKTPIVPFSILNLAYTQNPATSNGKITNNLEAEFVAKLLKALDGFIPNKYNSYGVITPYAHHRTTLESAIRSLGLTNIMVNTIDSYQGLEKDVIIISNARTNGIGFLSNPQRLNVALTRPKKCLILCGNFKNLETVPAWRCLLENARNRQVYHEISTDCVSDIQRNVIDKIRIRK